MGVEDLVQPHLQSLIDYPPGKPVKMPDEVLSTEGTRGIAV